MKTYIKELFSTSKEPKTYISQISLEYIAEANTKLKLIAEHLDRMSEIFCEGGSITFDELNEYSVSTPEKPIKYPTGKNCYAYRLPTDSSNKIKFYCTFEPSSNKIAAYGWHNHPDCEESVIQLKGEALVNGKIIKPFTKTEFKTGQYHDYSMKEYGEILVTFTKTK